MVLLDALTQDRLAELVPNYQLTTANYQLIVAHFDHGIRGDSREDESFARGVAEEYGLQYETERAELGSDASEEQARTARYDFLRRCCKKYDAQLVTAHHQDDVIETMIINLIRGTGWRGLAPMTPAIKIPNPKSQIPTNNQESIINNQTIRPLINVPKAEILAYAKEHAVQWREDSTNTDTKYLRNHIRHNLLPRASEKDKEFQQKMLEINKNVTRLKNDIATELQKLTTNYSLSTTHYEVPRYDLIMLPRSVAHELIYAIISYLSPDWHPGSGHIKRVLHFAKTAHLGKAYHLSKNIVITSHSGQLQFKKTV